MCEGRGCMRNRCTFLTKLLLLENCYKKIILKKKEENKTPRENAERKKKKGHPGILSSVKLSFENEDEIKDSSR